MPEPATVEVNGAAIRTLRKRAGTEMSDLATQAGITANYLSRIETGTRRRLRPSVFKALRTALGATNTQILANDEDATEKEHPGGNTRHLPGQAQ